MIYFVTNRINHQVNPQAVNIIDINKGKQISKEILSKGVANADFEASGLNTHLLNPVLFAIGNEKDQLVIDLFVVNLFDVVNKKQLEDTLLIGSNFSYDLKILKWHYDTEIKKIWDTERVDRKLYQGYAISKDNPNGLYFNLKAQHERHLRFIPESMQDKEDTRMRFVGQTKNSYIPLTIDVVYAAGDVQYLSKIKEKQEILIKKFNQSFYVDNICNILTENMIHTELRGFNFDKDKWIELIHKHEELEYESALKLDLLVLDLRDKLLDKEERKLLIGDKYTNKRAKQFLRKSLGLFGEIVADKDYYGKAKPKINLGNIQWGNADDIMDVCARLKIPLPIKNDKDKADGKYSIPKVLKVYKSTKNGVEPSLKLDKTTYKFTTGKDAIHLMLNTNPSIIARGFYEEFIEFRKYKHYISGFGYNFLDKINPVTGRIHTIYRTERAITGRLQSGGGTKQPEYYNSQNIPRPKEFRNCFIATPGYSISTTDLSGAEVTILCDKAHDEVLYEWAVKNDDAHSPIATACWRNIYLWNAGLMAGYWKTVENFFNKKDHPHVEKTLLNHKNEVIKEFYRRSKEFTISKSENKEYRQIFKNVTFAVFYGARPKQVGITLSATKDVKTGQFIKAGLAEGEIAIETMKQNIPKTFAYLDRQVENAMNTGIVHLNDRTNGRIYLPHVIRHLKYGEELTFLQRLEAEGIARNAPIQGTQADMLKESIVEIHKVVRTQNLPAYLLKQVHDELVYEQKLEWDGVSKQWNNSQNSVMFPFKGKTDERLGVPQFVNKMMCTVANRYLNHYTMGAETEVLPYWTK